MAYSTEAELKKNAEITGQTFTPAELTTLYTQRVALADKIVKADCGKYINFSLVPDDDTTPVVNLLSQYKTAEMTLRNITGIKRRHNENDDISEWKQNYNDLKQKIAEGLIDVLLADGVTSVLSSLGTFQNTARPDMRPEQGYDKYGEWLNNDDMKEVRGDPDTTKYV